MSTGSWILIAFCLVVTGVALYRGLWSDRARGRRRCRQCWHPVLEGMGATATCAECGFTARRERDWTRSRRRWRWVGLAVVALAAAVASGLGPRVRAHGIESLLPTPTLGWILQRTGSTRALALYLERRTGDPVIISRGATLGTFLGDGEVPAH